MQDMAVRLSGYLSKLSLPSLGVTDILEIALISFFIYQFMVWIKFTRAYTLLMVLSVNLSCTSLPASKGKIEAINFFCPSCSSIFRSSGWKITTTLVRSIVERFLMIQRIVFIFNTYANKIKRSTIRIPFNRV